MKTPFGIKRFKQIRKVLPVIKMFCGRNYKAEPIDISRSIEIKQNTFPMDFNSDDYSIDDSYEYSDEYE